MQLDRAVVEERRKENEKRAAEGQELLSEIEPLPTDWPNEERRAAVGAMLQQFLEQDSSVQRDLDARPGTYERNVAFDRVKELLERLKLELNKEFEDRKD